MYMSICMCTYIYKCVHVYMGHAKVPHKPPILDDDLKKL